MKPDSSQQLWLEAYLRKALNYRETYDEIYDHMLTALSYRVLDEPFEKIVSQIMMDDFGGHENLPKLEKASKRAVEKEGITLFMKNFLSCFKFPQLVYTAIATGLVYYCIIHVSLSPKYIYLLLAVIMIAIPAIFVISAWFKIIAVLKNKYESTGVVFNHTLVKPSIRSDVYSRVILIPFCAFVLTNVLLPVMGFEQLDIRYNHNPVFITSVLMIAIMYAGSVIKLSQHDFDINYIPLTRLINQS